MKDGVPEQPSGFTYIISQVSDSTLSPHPLPTSRYRELLRGAMHKKRREWQQHGRPPQKASLCWQLRAGSPAARARAAAVSVAPRAASNALAAHSVCGAVPANPGNLL